MRRAWKGLLGLLVSAAIAGAFLWDWHHGGGWVRLVGGAGFTLVGAGVTLTGVWFLIRQALLLRRGRTVPGKVIDLAKTNGCFAPVFRFSDAQAIERVVTSGSGSNRPTYRVGDQVAVLFDPDQPEQAVIRSFVSMWLPGVVVTGFGLIALVIGLLFLFADSRKESPKRSPHRVSLHSHRVGPAGVPPGLRVPEQPSLGG
jgi:hypothetical protein